LRADQIIARLHTNMTKSQTTFESLIEQGRKLFDTGQTPSAMHDAFMRWDSEVARWLAERVPGTGLSAEWSALGSSPLFVGRHYYDSDHAWVGFRHVVERRLLWLAKTARAAQQQRQPMGSDKRPVSPSGRVFLVHGHNESIRETVARFLEKLKLTPVILHEQPNKGRTIIEKFIDYSDVAFAVVLLTADDRGAATTVVNEQLLTPRARQNVILELGFFLGKLGREQVCSLYEDGVEIPSDYQGVLFLKLDKDGAWRLRLAKELKEAGLPIDLNDAI
jgi:predicted nucleotide-binding protein